MFRLAGLIPCFAGCACVAAVDVPDVRTLDDLRRAPAVEVENNWDAHFGLADSGADGGPWMLVYCLMVPRPNAGRYSIPHFGSDRLGPFVYRCTVSGDKVALQVLYSESGFDEIRETRSKRIKGSLESKRGLVVPLVSDRIEVTVTERMLRLLGRAGIEPATHGFSVPRKRR